MTVEALLAGVPESWACMLRRGWSIKSATCECGGGWAWFHPQDSGALEVVGCVCHTELPQEEVDGPADPDARIDQLLAALNEARNASAIEYEKRHWAALRAEVDKRAAASSGEDQRNWQSLGILLRSKELGGWTIAPESPFWDLVRKLLVVSTKLDHDCAWGLPPGGNRLSYKTDYYPFLWYDEVWFDGETTPRERRVLLVGFPADAYP